MITTEWNRSHGVTQSAIASEAGEPVTCFETGCRIIEPTIVACIFMGNTYTDMPDVWATKTTATQQALHSY